MKKTLHQIYVNGNFLRQPKTGVQRYGNELLDQFDRLLSEDPFYSEVEIVCLTPPINNFTPRWKNITVRSFGVGHHHIWEQFLLPFAAWGGLLFSPSNLGPVISRAQVVTLHDASIYAVAEAYTFEFKLKYYSILAVLARTCRGFLTDSEFSRSEITKYLPINEKRIKKILLGGDHLSRVNPDMDAYAKLDLKNQGFYLLVGSRSKHKNTAIVYKSLDQMGFTGKLVHIGGNFNAVFESHASHIPNFTVVDPGYVSDELLRALYQNAKALIFPSIYEGFGFPPLEAMFEGCPVVSSTAASIPEVVGDASLTFSPNNENELIARLNELDKNSAAREDLIAKGKQRAAQFTWEKTAKLTLDELLQFSIS